MYNYVTFLRLHTVEHAILSSFLIDYADNEYNNKNWTTCATFISHRLPTRIHLEAMNLKYTINQCRS